MKNPFSSRKRSGQFGLRSSNDPVQTEEATPVITPYEKERKEKLRNPSDISTARAKPTYRETNDTVSIDRMNEQIKDMPLD